MRRWYSSRTGSWSPPAVPTPPWKSRLASAAQITDGGARQMDTIVAQTRSIAEVAGSARTPAAEMMVLKALRTQVARAQSVVASTQQQSSQAAGRGESAQLRLR